MLFRSPECYVAAHKLFVQHFQNALRQAHCKCLEDTCQSALEIMDALSNTVEAIPTVGNYYTFVYNAKTAGKQYDQHPLIACTDLFRWGFRGINFHWQSSRNYTWEELTGQVYMVKSIELDDLLAIPYAKFITK